MKRIVLATAAMALASTSALSATTTVEFKRDSGETAEVTFDGEGGAKTSDGNAMTYTFDTETGKMCFDVSETEKRCIVYAEVLAEPKVGDSVRYTADDGVEGTATITAMAE